jgi:hypothetical protein
LEIIPGVGVGKVKFGMNKSDVILMLGEPDRREEVEYNSVTHDQASRFYYFNLKLCLSFECDDDYRLGCITVLGYGYKLFNRDLYNLPKDTVRKLVAKCSGEIAKDEDWSTDEDSSLECLDHDGLSILFWFKNGYLNKLECSYFFEPDGETVIWP